MVVRLLIIANLVQIMHFRNNQGLLVSASKGFFSSKLFIILIITLVPVVIIAIIVPAILLTRSTNNNSSTSITAISESLLFSLILCFWSLFYLNMSMHGYNFLFSFALRGQVIHIYLRMPYFQSFGEWPSENRKLSDRIGCNPGRSKRITITNCYFNVNGHFLAVFYRKL